MLTEELRPKNLDDIYGQELNIKIIKGFLKNNKLPHMLFHGPAGTGKTTTGMCIAREYYGKEWTSYFIELNASDERGIDTIRNKIKRQASTVTLDYPFKIIFMDECDSLTNDAQNALRRTMEKYSNKTVFILSCNYKNKLIDPLINRCVLFPFKPLPKKYIKKYIKDIADQNGIHFTPKALDNFTDYANGSARPVLNTFEKFIATNLEQITPEIVSNYTNQITEQDIINLCGFIKEESVQYVDNYIDNVILAKGYEPPEVLERMREFIKTTKLYTTKQKLTILKLLGDIDFRIAQGATPSIQFKTFFAYLLMQARK